MPRPSVCAASIFLAAQQPQAQSLWEHCCVMLYRPIDNRPVYGDWPACVDRPAAPYPEDAAPNRRTSMGPPGTRKVHPKGLRCAAASRMRPLPPGPQWRKHPPRHHFEIWLFIAVKSVICLVKRCRWPDRSQILFASVSVLKWNRTPIKGRGKTAWHVIDQVSRPPPDAGCETRPRSGSMH